MTNGPTKGATEPQNDAGWKAAPGLALAIRAIAFLTPLAAALVSVRLVSGWLIRPPGWVGLAIWVAQATAIGTSVSMVVDRGTRKLLPLAALFGMSLAFPDQAPSRFSLALRSGTVKRMQAKLDDVQDNGLGSSESEAASRAVELVSGLGHHDRLTRGHTERVRAYADLIAVELGLSEADQARLSWGVLLHDIGKLTVPPEILNSPSRPTEEEWAILRNHPAASREMLEPLANWLGEWVGAASDHHERWDGKGYPRGLAGTEISLAGRIAAVADAYDVITSKRSYKEPMSAAAARKELVDNAGSQFDPTVVRAFLNVSLGRRWTVGPLAWLSDVPFGQIATTVTTAPAVASVGAITAAASLVTVPVVEDPEPEQLLFSSAAEIETTTTTELITTTSLVPTITVAPEPSPTSTEPPTTVATSDTEPAATSSSTTTPSTTVAPTTESAPTTTTTAQTTTTTTAAPTTTTTAPTTTTTAAPTTTTTAPTTTTTTTAPTTTTTAASTTTTSPPVGTLYFLHNSGADGDSPARTFKTLDPGAVQATGTQPNFDTDRDSVPGLSLQTTGAGWSENGLEQIQRYGRDPGSDDLNGPAKITLYAAADSDVGGSPVTLRVALSNCDWLYQNCSNIAQGSVQVSNNIQTDGFAQFVVDFGSVSEPFSGFGRRMVVRLIAEGGTTLHIAFDSTPHPAVLDVTWD